MAELRGGLYVPVGPRSTVQVQIAGDRWDEVPGIESVAYEAGTRDSTTITALEGEATSLGPASIEPVTLNISAFNPVHPVFAVMQESFGGTGVLNFRSTTPGTKFVPSGTGNTASGTTAQVVAASTPTTLGGLTLSDAAAPFFENGTIQRGMVLVTASNKYVIQSIDVNPDTGKLTPFVPSTVKGGVRVSNLGAHKTNVAAAAAASFQVWGPGIRWSFAARMESGLGMNYGAGADAPSSGTITLRPTVTIGLPIAVLTTDASAEDVQP